jgi:hypothetical protein
MKTITTSVVAVIAIICFFGTVSVAKAQSEAVKNIYAYGATEATNIAGVYRYPAPPKGFDPLTATEVALATHGFPARPDEKTDANHYATWKRAMQAAKIRGNGEFQVRQSPGGGASSGEIPFTTVQKSTTLTANPAVTGPTQLTSTIWSGVTTTNKLTKWNAKSSFTDVFGIFTVPVIQPPFGSCPSDTSFQVISWIGLDIDPNSEDMALGAGSSSNYFCDNSSTGYHAVFYSFDSTQYFVFDVRPGDVMYVEVSDGVGGSAPGTIFVEDLTTLTYQSISIAPNRPIIGNSAGWLVGSGTNFPTYELGNTIATFFGSATAYSGSHKMYYPGSAVPATHVFTMQDHNRTQNIELVTSGSTGNIGKYGLEFQTTGCAFTGGCAP